MRVGFRVRDLSVAGLNGDSTFAIPWRLGFFASGLGYLGFGHLPGWF